MKIIDFRARPNTPEYMNAFGLTSPETCTLSEFVEQLDKAGIDLAVFTGRQNADGFFPNDIIANSVAAFPNRLVGFGSVDARSGEKGIVELERCVTDLGLRGLALDPPGALHGLPGNGYDDEALMYPLYEKCEELSIPVVLTLGPRTVPFGGPQAADHIASRFPNLVLVCSHACWPEALDWVAVAMRNSNIYIEPSLYWHFPGNEAFVESVNTIIPNQVLYGSGFPFDSLDAAARFQKLSLTDEVKHKVMFENAARLLGLVQNS